MENYELKFMHLKDRVKKLLTAQKEVKKNPKDAKKWAIVNTCEEKVLEIIEPPKEKTLFDLGA